jgi:type IV pilus assembly protein PilA
MKSFFSRLKRDEGFTLVELMVVVAIIGLLSAVAIPNFKKYQAKSKTSEAKLQLASLYSAETSWYSDYDYYATCLNLQGFDPSGEVGARYYAVGFASSAGHTDLSNAGAPAACTSAHAGHAVTNAAYTGTAGIYVYVSGKKLSGVAAAAATSHVTGLALAPTVDASGTAFIAGAIGIIDKAKITATDADVWSIDQNKRLRNNIVGY